MALIGQGGNGLQRENLGPVFSSSFLRVLEKSLKTGYVCSPFEKNTSYLTLKGLYPGVLLPLTPLDLVTWCEMS